MTGTSAPALRALASRVAALSMNLAGRAVVAAFSRGQDMDRTRSGHTLVGLTLMALTVVILAGPSAASAREPVPQRQPSAQGPASSSSASPSFDIAGLTARAESGDARAQFDLGWKYHEGDGIPQDYEQAARWLRRAADQGLLTAQVRLGNLFEWGHGVPEDPLTAAAWYQRAADAGLAVAHFALGKLSLDGTGVPKDAAKAVASFRRAADGGFPMAAFVLGQLYLSGEGVERDPVEAYAWLRVAMTAPELPPFVAAARERVASTLNAAELEKAERRVSELLSRRKP
jgi:hypothetical protein